MKVDPAPSGEYRKRYLLLGTVFASLALVIIFQIFRLQIGPEAQRLRDAARMYERELHLVYPARGQIVDRWGKLLAGNQTVYEIGVDLQTKGKNPETIAFVLSRVLSGHPEYNRPEYYDQIFTAASASPTTTTIYTVLADFVTEEELGEIKSWAQEYENLYQDRKSNTPRPTLSGLVFRPHFMRSYPEKTLASNIIGFVNRDGEGQFGVEARFDSLLKGEPQLIAMPADPTEAEEMPYIPNGATLILTLDREIQAMAEEVIDQAVEVNSAEAGTILIMDPQSGEILAMATTPRLDVNEYWRYGEVFTGNTPFNRAVSKDYEPGSIFKVLTMAAALDSETVKPETTFVDTGSFLIGGYYIHNWNWGAWGEQNMTGCLQHSLNVCLAWVASQMGNDIFYSYMQKFGIGRLTGVDIYGEVPGRLKVPGDSDWYDVELGTNSYGQGVAVNPVQIVSAIAAVANHGQMMAPHVLLAYVDKGQQYTLPARPLGQPIRPETAHTLSEMLAISLEDEASDALVAGYRIAGKTGTASIAGPTGQYDSDLTNASFIGWGPVDDPRFIVYVWLEKPTTSPWGSVVAAPVFRQIVERLVILMNIPPDAVRLQLSGQ